MPFQYWTDQHLKWDPQSFDNVQKIAVDPDLIWVPNLSILNSETSSALSLNIKNAFCELASAGLVQCSFFTDFNIVCIPDLKRWPFDSTMCSTILGSYVIRVVDMVSARVLEIN